MDIIKVLICSSTRLAAIANRPIKICDASHATNTCWYLTECNGTIAEIITLLDSVTAAIESVTIVFGSVTLVFGSVTAKIMPIVSVQLRRHFVAKTTEE